jgi:hypothetical protein
MDKKVRAEPREGGAGSTLEIVDMLCSVTQDLADIVRKQATLIEQEKIASAIYPELCERRKTAENELDIIEQKLRRL